VKILPASGLVACAALLALVSPLLIVAPAAWPALALGWLLPLWPTWAEFRWLRRNRDRFGVALEVPPRAVRGDALRARVEVRNDTDRTVRFRVRPLLPVQAARGFLGEGHLQGQRGTVFDIEVLATRRGDYRFGPVYLRVAGPYRLLQAQLEFPVEAICEVLPDVRRVKDYIVSRRTHSALAPHVQTARLRGIGSEFESLRGYEEGDDIRRMDWKATARHGTLITRNYEIEHSRDVLLVLDRGRLMAGKVGDGTKLDHAIDAALMLAGVALDSGDRCGVMVFDDDVLAFLPPRAGMDQLQRIVEALHDVEPTLSESHFRRAFVYLQTRLTKRSLVVVLSDVMDADASAATVAGMLTLGRRHLVVFTALRTPEVQAVLEEPLDNPAVPYRKAVAYRLIRERADTIARIERGGIHVLDVDPDALTIPVVNKYIELREANRL
jgi:uncharacterized protein (DUF58 family)